MILLLSDQSDAHYKYVKNILDGMGVETVTMNTTRFPTEESISFSTSTKNRNILLLEIGGVSLEGKDISSVWNRRTPPTVHKVQDPHVREYIDKESQSFFDSLPYLVNAFWINHPEALKSGSMKTHQLRVASESGLSVPDTYIGNSPAQMRDFAYRYDYLAVKSIFMPAVQISSDTENDRLILYTRKVSRSDIINLVERAQNCPVILQPYVEKDFELRVTVVGNSTFACAIHSQKSKKAMEDWRRYDIANTPHSVFELPQEIHQKLITFTKSLGLVFGCVDMIVTPKGEFVFLEINPNGQWLWIERLTDMPIGRELARLIVVGGVDSAVDSQQER